MPSNSDTHSSTSPMATHGHLLTHAARPQQPSHSSVLSPAPHAVHFVPTSQHQHLCWKPDCYETELSMSLPRIVHCQLLTICHTAPNSARSAHPPPSHSHASSNSISGGLSSPLPTPSTATLLRRCRAVRSSIGESPDWHCCSNITPTWLAQKTTWSSWPLVRLQGQYSCRASFCPCYRSCHRWSWSHSISRRRHEPEAWAQCERERWQIQVHSIVSVLMQVRPHSFSLDMIAISFCNSCQFAKRNWTCSPLLMPLVSSPPTNPSPCPWWFWSPSTRLWLCHYSLPALHWITPLVARQV